VYSILQVLTLLHCSICCLEHYHSCSKALLHRSNFSCTPTTAAPGGSFDTLHTISPNLNQKLLDHINLRSNFNKQDSDYLSKQENNKQDDASISTPTWRKIVAERPDRQQQECNNWPLTSTSTNLKAPMTLMFL
jgi:hypothetical protein